METSLRQPTRSKTICVELTLQQTPTLTRRTPSMQWCELLNVFGKCAKKDTEFAPWSSESLCRVRGGATEERPRETTRPGPTRPRGAPESLGVGVALVLPREAGRRDGEGPTNEGLGIGVESHARLGRLSSVLCRVSGRGRLRPPKQGRGRTERETCAAPTHKRRKQNEPCLQTENSSSNKGHFIP